LALPAHLDKKINPVFIPIWGSKTIHLSCVIVTLSVDSRADNATFLAGYVPVFDQTTMPKAPILMIGTKPIYEYFIIFMLALKKC
jgi:hypothetical protein